MARDLQTLQKKLIETYPCCDEVFFYSAPGRTEICGNHTDHQFGCVLAGAVDLEVLAAVSFTNGTTVQLYSEGYSECVVDISDTRVHDEEKGVTESIIRGVAAGFVNRGAKVGGFNAYVTSNVAAGSGLSSSAAFEVLLGTIFDKRFNAGRLGPIEIAKIGQEAENVYFGKQSGLMDQMVSSVGGLVFIDFKDPDSPRIEKHLFDFGQVGLNLFITNTKGSHADLIEDYVAIPEEMNSVAAQLGAEHLRSVDPQVFYEKLPDLRRTCSDRALLRAGHFFAENERVIALVDAMDAHDESKFLRLVRESGESSARQLQNLYSTKDPSSQAIPLAIMLSQSVLGQRGAARVHGGGFAGTIQAFVPTDLSEEYRHAMDSLFGDGSCMQLKIRGTGGMQIVQ